MGEELTHLTEAGEIHMVDVSGKGDTSREAEAEAIVAMSEATRRLLFSGGGPKGDALAAARLAGIMAAKRTPDLIPLAHPLRLDAARVDLDEVEEGVRIVATVTTKGPTGVEMEAMTAAAVAALTLYDMVKGLERGVEIRNVRLMLKRGGRSGEWVR